MFQATPERSKPLLESEEDEDPIGLDDQNGPSRQIGNATYVGVKKRVNAALRWAAVKNKTSWAGIILGDSMPAAWFNYRVTPAAKWDDVLRLLSLYSKDIYAVAMSELVEQLGNMVPVTILQSHSDDEFLSWFDGRVDPLGYCGALASVSWVAGRIAQVWGVRSDAVPAGNYCFTQLQDIKTDWPDAGSCPTKATRRSRRHANH
jgi:hypothetical protein